MNDPKAYASVMDPPADTQPAPEGDEQPDSNPDTSPDENESEASQDDEPLGDEQDGEADKTGDKPGDESEPGDAILPQPETIGGVKYDRDADGNYCIGGVPQLGPDKRPFYNQVREFQRKAEDAERKLRERQPGSPIGEIDRIKAELNDKPDDEIDDETGLTYGQLRAIDRRNATARAQELAQLNYQSQSVAADAKLRQNTAELQRNPKLASFFSNPVYVTEYNERVNALPLQTALIDGIEREVVNLIIGRHFDKFEKTTAASAAKAALRNRRIVGESQVLHSGPAGAPKRYPLTDAVRDFARTSGFSVEIAAEMIYEREQNRKKLAKGGR